MQYEWQKRLFSIGGSILKALPFLLLFYSFASPAEATLSVVAVLLHEGAHLLAFLFVCKRGGAPSFSAAINGFRLKSGRLLSYDGERTVLLAGPLSNLLFFVAFRAFPSPLAKSFASVNLLTAIGNLLPIENYDGYRIVENLCQKAEKSSRFLRPVSLGLSLFFAFVSLYAILRTNGGYFAHFAFLSEFFREAKTPKKSSGDLS